jgi:hypothetical protein
METNVKYCYQQANGSFALFTSTSVRTSFSELRAVVPGLSDFDHPTAICIFLQSILPVRLNMIEANNGNAPTTSAHKYTGTIILRTRPHTYKRVVRLLSEGVPAIRIARDCKVTETLRGGYCDA